MALIQCPRCGKEISDLAKICVHCGYSLKAPTNPDAAGETAEAPAAPEETAAQPQAPAYNGYYAGNPEEAVPAKKNMKKWLIIGGAALAVILTVVLIIIFTGNGKKTDGKEDGGSGSGSGALPTYGLRIGMSQDEIISTMKKAGYTFTEESWYSGTPLFSLACNDGTDVLGVNAGSFYIYAEREKASYYCIQYVISNPDYSSDDHKKHDTIRNALTEKLGEPVKKDRQEIWETNGEVYLLDENSGVFTLIHCVGVSTYEEMRNKMSF
jgi:hypothetical protein